jgi:hypothetical protein
MRTLIIVLIQASFCSNARAMSTRIQIKQYIKSGMPPGVEPGGKVIVDVDVSEVHDDDRWVHATVPHAVKAKSLTYAAGLAAASALIRSRIVSGWISSRVATPVAIMRGWAHMTRSAIA